MAKKNLKNFKVPVFKAEREAGLASQIQSNASIAYVAKLIETSQSQTALVEFLKANANSDIDPTQFDLFYLNTILVTTGWNKNADVFGKLETWASRYTPVHKPFNLEHDQSKIIGHMTSALAVNEKYEVIADDTSIDELPDKFHILTGAVIYKAFADEKAQESVDKMIEEIAEGKWFVSMECLFCGFDYAVTGPDGEQRVLARSEETAFLTKHLRQYGGTGKYQDFSLGRYLKNITFSGKGLVENPANPESIIFNENISAFHTSFASVGYLSSSEQPSTANTNKDIQDTKETRVESAMAETKDELAVAGAKVTELEKTNKDLTAEVADLKTKVSAKDTEITELKAQAIKDGEAVKAAETRAVTAEGEIAKVKAEEVVRARTALLTEKGCGKDEAAEIVETFKGLDETGFVRIVTLSESKWKTPVVATETPKAEPKVDATVLEEVKAEEKAPLNVSATGGEESNEKLRTAIAALYMKTGFNANAEPEDEDEDESDKTE